MNATESIDPYSGAAELSVELINLPGRNGLDLNVSLRYSSRVYDAATIWNLTEPTDVPGLGWTLPYQGILAIYGSNVSDVSYYLVAGAHSGNLIRTGVNERGMMLFELDNYSFWGITYDPANQRWQVIREDGNTWIYGDQNNSRGTVQWGIGWDNWRGASNQQAGQIPVPVAFNLSQIVNRFDDTMTWEYDSVVNTVGPQTDVTALAAVYTQASYLKRITGVTGESVLFSYQEKSNDSTLQEYVVPHTNPSPPNAYQDRYQTRYLDSVTMYGTDGTVLFTQQLKYEASNGQPAFLGTGDMAKRLLTAIEQTPAASTLHLPGPGFTYCGQDSADMVSAAAPFNETTHCLYGALKSLKTPGGGTITYQYDKVSPTLSSRNVTLTPPVQTGVTFSNPRFHFEARYVVTTWLGSDNSLRVSTNTWDGRWVSPNQATGLDSLPIADATAYDAVPMICDAEIFAALSQNQVHLYQADASRAGMWIQPSVTQGGTTVNYFTTDFASDEMTQLVAGRRFAAVLGLGGGKLFRYRATGSGWQSDAPLTLSAGVGANTYAVAARDNYLLAVYTLQAAGSNPVNLHLDILDETGNWRQAGFHIERQLSQADTATLFAGDTFAVAMLTDDDDASGSDVEYIAIWWSADGSRLASLSLGVFSVSSAEVVQPVIKGNSIAIGQMLYRFDGVTWRYQNISGSGSTLQSRAYAADLILRTLKLSDTQYSYDLTQYDPNTGNWSSALNASEGTASNFNLAAKSKHHPSPYAVLDSRLYYRQPDGTWQQTSVSIPALSGDDANSPALASDRFLIYQQAGNTIVYPLENGAPLAQVQFTGEQVYTSATSLVGENAFVAYTGTFGDASSTLTLYRVEAGAVTGTIDCYVVTAHLADNGYQTITTGYAYNAATAVSAFDRALRSNQTTKIAGSADPDTKPNGWTDLYYFNGLAPNEIPALPYPADSNYTNAANFYSTVEGVLYNGRIYPSSTVTSNFVSEIAHYIWVYAKTSGQLRGYYLRTLKASSVMDGVSSDITSTFSTDTGLVTQAASSNFNSSGLAEHIITEYEYFWEVYDPQRALNLLTPIIQTTFKTLIGSATTTTGILVTTYRDDWGSGNNQWAPDRTYHATDGNAPAFVNWQPGQGDPSSGWLRTSTVLDLTATGLPRRTANVDGAIEAIIYDASNLMPVASFVNADPDGGEASYYGFDRYEKPGGWGWSEPGHSIRDNITLDDYHTGMQCLKVLGTPGQKVGPVRKFLPLGQNRTYVFGCWIKTQPGFDPAQGQAAFEITAYPADGTQATIPPLTIPLTDTGNQWVYKQQIINLSQLRAAAVPPLPATTPLYLHIAGWNQNSAGYLLVDNMRFSPVDAFFAANVYEPAKRLLTAEIGNNGETGRTIYDMYDRIVATVSPNERVDSLSTGSYSRDLTASDTFLPDFPNSTLRLGTTSASFYYDFHDNAVGDWKFDGAGGDWNITGGQLAFTGTSTDPLGSTAVLDKIAFTNFALRVVCTSHAGSVGVGNGDSFVYWDGTNSVWTLVRRQSGAPPTQIASSTAVGFHPDMIYVIIEGLLLFYAGGVLVFAYDYQNPNTSLPDFGKPALLLTSTGSFDDLIVLDNPQFSVAFQDGLMGEMQSVSLLGYTSGETYLSVGQGVFLDSLGRAYVDRKGAQPPLAIAAPDNLSRSLIEGNQTTYLVNSAGLPVSLQDYLDGTFGFDYMKYQFEPSPLSRINAVTLPRESNQSANNFTISYDYGTATASIIQGILPAGTEQNYFLRTITDQDGVKCYQIFDQTGKIIAKRIQTGTNTYLTTAIEYDQFGNAITFKQPNFFAPPPNSQASTWQEARTYTFNRLLASRTTPDAGQFAYLYDNSNRLRFVSTADGAALTPPQFVYMKYDALGRCVEDGYIQDAGVVWANLADHVNDQTFPELGTITGAWLKQRVYDDDNQGTLNLLGRLWRVRVNNDQTSLNPDTETFYYDAFGNIISVASVTPSVSTDAYQSIYAYDNQDNVINITYPHKATETTPFQVAYYYDRLGRLAAVGKPVNSLAVIDPANPATGDEELYASYAYDGSGKLVAESLNNRSEGATSYAFLRNYDYDEPGWLTRIDDPFFTQEIAYYEQPGDNGTTYYSGVVSQTNFKFKAQPGFQAQAEYGYSYAYDSLKRLSKAVNSLTDAGNLTIDSQGYDANGNLLQLARGVTTELYSYQESATSQTQNDNRVYNVTESVAASIDFSSSQTGWSRGANNGGPSNSLIVPHNGGQALQLGGGSLGHFEFLQLDSYLAPEGVYDLTYLLMTPAGFASGTGDVGWYLLIRTAANTVVTVPIGTIPDTGGAWQQCNISAINVGSLITNLAPGAEPTGIILQLRNYRRPTDGNGPGASITVTNINLTTTANVAGGTYQYYPGGAVKVAPDRAITQITYDAVTSLARQIQQGTQTPLSFSYDASDARLLMTAGALSRLYLRGPDSNPLRIETIGAAQPTTYHVYGPKGLLGIRDADGQFFFVLKDHLGSTRLLVSDAKQVAGGIDYLPFGESLRIYGSPNTDYLFTGQELDSQTGLYNFMARPYDPALQRFYGTDPAGEYPSPYVYVGNSPTNWTDPLGLYTKGVSDFISNALEDSYEAAWRWTVFTGLSMGAAAAGRAHYGWRWKGAGAAFLAPYVLYFGTSFGQLAWNRKNPFRSQGQGYWINIGTFLEDTFHLQFYFAPWLIDGIEKLGPRSASPIQSGIYVFIADYQTGQVSYRSAGDRLQGHQLYVRHSQLAGGDWARTAGMFWVRSGGRIVLVPKSGHYTPSKESVAALQPQFAQMGYQVEGVEDYVWSPPDGWWGLEDIQLDTRFTAPGRFTIPWSQRAEPYERRRQDL